MRGCVLRACVRARMHGRGFETKSDPAEESIDRYSKVLAYLFRVISLATRIDPRSQLPLLYVEVAVFVRSIKARCFERLSCNLSNVAIVVYPRTSLCTYE